MNHKPYGPYERFIKRPIDFCCGLAAVVVFCWLYLILIVLGAIFMRGNPFFTQERPGKDEKIFKLIKFRTMDNRRDKDGNLLPDEVRLNKYGRFLRKTSLDELPEAFNIIKGDMSVIGPRPLLVRYLPRYNDEQKHRHDVRPGLTGYAQAHGRNALSWEDKFAMDVWYTQHVTFLGDVRIIWDAFFIPQLHYLAKNGFEVSVVCSPDASIENELGKDIEYIPVDIPRGVSLFGSLRAIRELRTIFERKHFSQNILPHHER